MLSNGQIALHLRAPVLSMSGYGTASRQIIDFLLEDSRFFVFLENVPWGGCPFIHENDLTNKENFQKYYACMAAWDQNKNAEFDISIQATIPNEFSKKAKLNIGWTAGIEVDRVTSEWIQKCNEMDLIIVPSEHSKKVLTETGYLAQNNQTGEKKEIRLQREVCVIPHWHNFEDDEKVDPETLGLNFETKRNLLFVGLWGNKGGFGEDRKNIANLIRWFLTHFGDNPEYGLVLKTSIITNSEEDFHHTKARIEEIKANFPPEKLKAKVYLLHEQMTDSEIQALYRHKQISGMISLTLGEGFGIPLLDAAANGLPVIATNWSGHTDFLRPKCGFVPIEFEMKDIPECQVWQGVIDKGARWASPSEEDFKRRVKKFLSDPRPIQKAAKENVLWLRENFGKEAIFSKWKEFYAKFVKNRGDSDASTEEDVRVLQQLDHERRLMIEVDSFKEKYNIGEKDQDEDGDEIARVLYVMPQSFGDCVISTSVMNSLLAGRHAKDEFYFATRPQYKEIADGLVEKYGIKVIDFDDRMMHTELTRRIFDFVYHPGINVQYVFSNWTNGNGDFGVKLLEEFAKSCNLSPREVVPYCLKPKETRLPKGKTIVSITPVSSKQSKSYKFWDDIVHNIKKMTDNVEIVQLGDKNEKLLDGVFDARGISFNESLYVVSKSVVHISPDTGTAHVAGALRIPHIVLFASTSVNQCAPVLFDKGIIQTVIEAVNTCNPKCYKDVCCKTKDGVNCLSAINPETICNEIYRTLQKINQQEAETVLVAPAPAEVQAGE